LDNIIGRSHVAAEAVELRRCIIGNLRHDGRARVERDLPMTGVESLLGRLVHDAGAMSGDRFMWHSTWT
jgi:hypothetical protein